jgi:hypothetical protein
MSLSMCFLVTVWDPHKHTTSHADHALSLTLSHTHSLTHSLSLTHTLSLSLSHTHTHPPSPPSPISPLSQQTNQLVISKSIVNQSVKTVNQLASR